MANALHQMRVALRRLRAAISLFSVVVGDDRAGAIKTELRWLAQELGPARDLDTLLVEVIKPLRKQHPNEPGLVSISNMFARKRLKSYLGRRWRRFSRPVSAGLFSIQRNGSRLASGTLRKTR